MIEFVSLHNHTSMSLTDSIIDPEKLFIRAKELGQTAIAITDHGTLAGAFDGLKYSKKHGVKCIMGCEFYFVNDVKEEKSKMTHVILLAKNHAGYKNLLLANKLANDNFIVLQKKVIPRIDWNILQQCSKDVICTTACGNGILGRYINTRNDSQAMQNALRLKDIFGNDLAFEVEPNAMRRNSSSYNDYEDQTLVNRKIVNMADKLGIKVIAATNAHYIMKEDSRYQDAWMCVGARTLVRAANRLSYPSSDFYMKSGDEVVKFLSRHFNERAEEFCKNTLFFADQCEIPAWINPIFSSPDGREFPEFPVKDQADYDVFLNWIPQQSDKIKNLKEDEQYLRYWCDCGLRSKVPQEKWVEYQERIDEELDVIEYRKFSSYIEIVADYVDFAKKAGISVGPGRGSAGGSLVCYLIGIHNADSIKHNLIFSRFINKFKAAFPDIDMDFPSTGRQAVHDYIRRKYGADNVAHVSNVITEKPKVYARDIARVFQLGGDHKTATDLGNRIADSIPKDVKNIKALSDEAPLFMEYAERYPQLKECSEHFNNKYKAWSTHAGGLVISRRPLVEIVPLRRDVDGVLALEYDKERAESSGLLKMDVLAISTLDVIDSAFEIISKLGKTVDMDQYNNFDSNDSMTYELIGSGKTFGVFQFGGSPGTMELCRKIKPSKIDDLAIINALARPNAKDIRKPFIETKNIGKKVELIHPSLESALAPTWGYALYEDCLMNIARDVAGWDLHQADNLRKLTKDKGKHPEEISKWRNDFITSAVNKKGLKKEDAANIWDEVIDKFQGYGFNRAHALSYSILGYQTAYLKAHNTLEFLIALLKQKVGSNAIGAKDEVRKIKQEIRNSNIRIIPPSINESEMGYKIIDESNILIGLDSLKSVSDEAVEEVILKRPFTDLNDFLFKVSSKKVKTSAIKAFAASGCLDEFDLTRKQIFLYIDDYKKKFQVHIKKGNVASDFHYPWPENIGEWRAPELYALENEYLGEGVSCSTLEAYSGFFDSLSLRFADIPKLYPDTGDQHDKWAVSGRLFEGVVKNYFEFKIKNENSKLFGETMAKVELEDRWGGIVSVTLFPSGLEHLRDRMKDLTRGKVKFEPGIAIHCSGNINWYEGSPSVIFEDLRKVSAFPAKPKDLKAKSVVMRSRAKPKVKSKKIDKQLAIEELQESLIEQGFIIDD
jgi:DNA polymerase-3 subunit alpha